MTKIRTSMTRRTMATTAVVASVAAHPGLAAAAQPDADLLELGFQLHEAWVVEKQLWQTMEGTAYSRERETTFDAACEATGQIVDRIAGLHATTLAGLEVKALACSYCHAGEPIDFPGPSGLAPLKGATDLTIAAGIVQDLLSMKPMATSAEA